MINVDQIEAPELLAGKSLDIGNMENRNIAQGLKQNNIIFNEVDIEANKTKLEARMKAEQASVFREKEVDSLHALIYGE